MNAVSFHGFGGAFAVALDKIGIKLEAVIEPGGFGASVIEANREALGFTGPIHTLARDNPVVDADILIGNPPCSGFSGLNTATTGRFRGADSPINQCMWDLIEYASKMNGGKGPKIVAFESVQGAGKQGRGLMVALNEDLRARTGEDYTLHHVFMSGASVGAAQMRKRYFFVASKIPFGITSPVIERVATYEDAIGDLADLKVQWEPQEYVSEPSWWCKRHEIISPAGVVGDHVPLENAWAKRSESLSPYWNVGESDRDAMRRLLSEGKSLPAGWEAINLEKFLSVQHFSIIVRIRPDESGRVITGSGGLPYMHYREPRTLTVREVARLMGFPDWFRWNSLSVAKAFNILGKQVPVQSWEWMLGHIGASLEGEGGPWSGEDVGINEKRLDVTHDYKIVYSAKSKVHGLDARDARHREQMAARPG